MAQTALWVKGNCKDGAALFLDDDKAKKVENFQERYMSDCTKLLMDAIQPCVVEYVYQSDSAQKCVGARSVAAFKPWHHGVFNALYPEPSE